MAGKKSELIELVNKENVSAIRILADRLDTEPDEVRTLIEDSLSEGTLVGSMTEDGERFFKSEIKLSDAPVIPSEVKVPDFMKFNSRPGIAISIIGFAIIVLGLFVNSFGLDIIEQDFGAIIVFVGIIILFTGLFCLSRRKTLS
ncbi:MAG: hypothetical protein ACXACG_00035 [Candidatus Thorarchaeota archaeon]